MRTTNLYLPLSALTAGFYVVQMEDGNFIYGYAPCLQTVVQAQFTLSSSRRACMLLVGERKQAEFLEQACAMRFEKLSGGCPRLIVGCEEKKLVSIIKDIVRKCHLEFMYINPVCVDRFYLGKLGGVPRGGYTGFMADAQDNGNEAINPILPALFNETCQPQ